jgi:hypothetical protein
MKLNLNPIVVSAVANSAPIPTDTRSNPTNIGVNVNSTGANTYQVQITQDDVYAPGYVASSGNWYTPPTGQFTGTLNGTAAGFTNGVITGFCTAVRLSVSVYASGSVSIQCWQTDSTQGG